MKQVPPLPGEEALYAWIGSVLEAAANDPEIKKTLKETAAQVESEMITPLLQWRLNGRAAGNGWNSPVNNAEWGTDYLIELAPPSRTCTTIGPTRRSTFTLTMTAKANN